MEKKQAKELSESTIVEKKPEVIKLSSGNSATLDAIFGKDDCHLKITGQEVENLIIALKGKTKPGAKKKIDIVWGDSTKKAGSYEVIHVGGFLTRDYWECSRNCDKSKKPIKRLLLPLNGTRWLRGNIINHASYSIHFIHNSAGHFL